MNDARYRADDDRGRCERGCVPRDPVPTTWASYARAFGLSLQRARIARGISQEDLAHRAGMTRTHYQQIERGWWKRDQAANPSLRAVTRLAQELGVEVGDLLPSIGQLRWE